MTWREFISYLVSSAIAAGLLIFLAWLMAQKPAAASDKPSSQAPADKDAPVVVAVVVPPEEEKKPDEKKPEEKPEPREKEGSPNTATAQKGKSETPMVPEKQPMPMPMPMEKEKIEPKEEKGDPVPMHTPMPTPMEKPVKPAELGNFQGVLPVINNTGQTSILTQRYPRREACWVLDRTAVAGEIRTTHHFLLTEDGKLTFEDASKQRFGDFTEAIMGYDTTQMMRTNEPALLKLYQHRDHIMSLGKVTASESNRLLYWGSYRHRGELRLLAPAIEAFHAAIKEGKIQFDPSRPDRLEVQWGEENGEPVVRAVHFSPANAPPVRLK